MHCLRKFYGKILSARKSSLKSQLVVLAVIVLTVYAYTCVTYRQSYDFEWLRGRNFLSIFVRPERDTALIVPVPLVDYEEQQHIMAIVMSAPTNFAARQAIRETWGKLIKPVFLIGVAWKDKRTMSKIAHEAKVCNDIIVEDFVDTYLNLTIKTAFAMKNFLQHFKSSKYLLKIDDDVYLGVENLKRTLETAPKDSLIGQLETSAKPVRRVYSQWYLPRFLYEDNDFPPYIYGSAYLIPGHMVQSIYDASMDIPFYTIEDVFFTGQVAGKHLNYSLHHSTKFRRRPIPLHNPCVFKDLIIIHQVPPPNLYSVWDQLIVHNKC